MDYVRVRGCILIDVVYLFIDAPFNALRLISQSVPVTPTKTSVKDEIKSNSTNAHTNSVTHLISNAKLSGGGVVLGVFGPTGTLQVHDSVLSVTGLKMVMVVVVVARVVVVRWEVSATGLATCCRVLRRVRIWRWFPCKQRVVVVETESGGKCDVHLAVRVGLH